MRRRPEPSPPRRPDLTVGQAVALAEEFGRDPGCAAFVSVIVTGPPDVCDRLRGRLRGMRLYPCDGIVRSGDARVRLQVQERPVGAVETTT